MSLSKRTGRAPNYVALGHSTQLRFNKWVSLSYTIVMIMVHIELGCNDTGQLFTLQQFLPTSYTPLFLAVALDRSHYAQP